MKGVELGTAKRMSEVIEEVAKVAAERVAVLTGPNLAKEIAARQPAAAVVACTDEAVARRLQTACHTPYFRPYTNTDVVGCELGGAVKNVIGLAVGIARRHGPRRQRQGARSSPAAWPRPPGSASRWAPTRTPSPVWPAWATWWPPAPRRCRATTPSAPTSAAA